MNKEEQPYSEQSGANFKQSQTKLKQEEIKEKSKLKQASQLVFMICACSYGITITILAIIAFAYFPEKEITDEYKTIMENWRQDVYNEVKFVDFDKNCPTDYQQLNMYEWVGNEEGCDCSNITSAMKAQHKLKQELYVGSCTSKQITAKCIKVQSNNAQQFQVFGYNNGKALFKFKVCGKKLKDFNFDKQRLQEQICSTEQKTCGGKYYEKKFCMKKDEQCPINEISFEQNDKIEQSKIVISNDSPIQLTHAYLSTYANNMPLIDFKITEGKGVCHNSSTEQHNHVLAKVKKDECNKIDTRYIKLWELSEKDLFQINNQKKQIKTMDNFNLSSTKMFGFYARPYIQWSMQCRESYLELMFYHEDSLHYIHNLQLFLMCITIFYFVISCIVLISYQLLNKMQPQDKANKYRLRFYKENKEKEFFTRVLLRSCLEFVLGIFIIIVYLTASGYYTFLRDTVENDCTDAFTQGILKNLMSTFYNNVYIFDYIIFYLWIIFLFFNIAVLIYVCTKKSQSNKHNYYKLKNQTANFKQEDFEKGKQLQESVIIKELPKQQSYQSEESKQKIDQKTLSQIIEGKQPIIKPINIQDQIILEQPLDDGIKMTQTGYQMYPDNHNKEFNPYYQQNNIPSNIPIVQTVDVNQQPSGLEIHTPPPVVPIQAQQQNKLVKSNLVYYDVNKKNQYDKQFEDMCNQPESLEDIPDEQNQQINDTRAGDLFNNNQPNILDQNTIENNQFSQPPILDTLPEQNQNQPINKTFEQPVYYNQNSQLPYYNQKVFKSQQEQNFDIDDSDEDDSPELPKYHRRYIN